MKTAFDVSPGALDLRQRQLAINILDLFDLTGSPLVERRTVARMAWLKRREHIGNSSRVEQGLRRGWDGGGDLWKAWRRVLSDRSRGLKSRRSESSKLTGSRFRRDPLPKAAWPPRNSGEIVGGT